jgi:hypothetical protein
MGLSCAVPGRSSDASSAPMGSVIVPSLPAADFDRGRRPGSGGPWRSADQLEGPLSANHRWRPPETQKSWRRPIFPKGCPLSIFGAGELDFRVRDGNGYGLSASVTRIRCVWMLFGCVRRRPEGRRLDFRWLPPADRAFCSRSSKSESRRGSIHDVPATDPRSVAVEVKPSTVSTAQLHPSPDFHMRPIKQVVSLRSYPVDPVGNLISRRASHLDAFSAYPDRT